MTFSTAEKKNDSKSALVHIQPKREDLLIKWNKINKTHTQNNRLRSHALLLFSSYFNCLFIVSFSFSQKLKREMISWVFSTFNSDEFRTIWLIDCAFSFATEWWNCQTQCKQFQSIFVGVWFIFRILISKFKWNKRSRWLLKSQLKIAHLRMP